MGKFFELFQIVNYIDFKVHIKFMLENEYDHGEAYNHCMFALRNKAGLTYREARVYLMANWELPEAIIKEWGISEERLQEIFNSAELKIQRSGHTLDEIYGNNGLRVMFIDP